MTPNPRVRVMVRVRVIVRVRVRVGKVRKPYQNFQMVPLSMTLSDRHWNQLPHFKVTIIFNGQ